MEARARNRPNIRLCKTITVQELLDKKKPGETKISLVKTLAECKTLTDLLRQRSREATKDKATTKDKSDGSKGM